MEAFDDAVRKLLWPAKRENVIWRTKNPSNLEIAKPVLPDLLQDLALEKDALGRPILRIGPIPAGTPVNLLMNIDPDFTQLDGNRIEGARKLTQLCIRIKRDLLEIKLKKLDDAQAAQVMKNLIPDLMELSKCPDLVEDKGHRFGADLGDADKEALIEFLKTL
jgi:hypothetical protein